MDIEKDVIFREKLCQIISSDTSGNHKVERLIELINTLQENKAVEFTDTDFCMKMSESSLEKVWGDKQGIAPREVEKKWTNNDVHNFLNDYVNKLSIKQIVIKKPICSNTICESINEFLKEREGKQ